MASHYKGTAEEQRALDLYIKLARAGESFSSRTSRPITEAGLTPIQFGVLEALYHLGSLMPSQLADKHLKSRNNLTAVIDRLEGEGFVRRERCPSDRRAQWIHLTDQGRDLIRHAFPKFVKEVVEDVATLSVDEQEQLAALLKKLGLHCC